MAKYAEDTRVPINRSIDELRRTLERYGADQRVIGDDPSQLIAGFRLRGIPIRVSLPLPPARSFPSIAAHERELRRLWRVLILLIKGRLELVAEGVESPEAAFMSYVVLPSGQTFGELALPEMREAREGGRMPASILPDGAASKIIALGSGR